MPGAGPHPVQAGAATPGDAAGAGLPAVATDSTHHAAAAVPPDSVHHTSPAVSDSARYAMRADSLHRSALSPKRVVGASAVTSAPAAPPVEHHPSSIVSWDEPGPKLTKTQRDSVHRAEKARKEAKRDSLKREEATRDSLKHAAKAAKTAPPAKPAAPPVPADSTQGQNP
jgi:hypothetical protein